MKTNLRLKKYKIYLKKNRKFFYTWILNTGLSILHIIKYWELIGKEWLMTSFRKTNDIICAKNACWFWSTYIAHKQFIFRPHYCLNYSGIPEFMRKRSMSTVAQTMQNIWNFMVGKLSLQEIATLAIIQEISYSNLETGRYSPQSGVPRIIRENWQHCQQQNERSGENNFLGLLCKFFGPGAMYCDQSGEFLCQY